MRLAARAASLALALCVALASSAVAEESDPEFPPELLALLPGWIGEAEALAAPNATERPWWPHAASFLEMAKDAQREGRFRVTLFQLETFTELVLSHQLIDEANATRRSDAERKTLIAVRTADMRTDSEAAWSEFRATMHGYDDELRSLQTIEKALYAGDLAGIGVLTLRGYDAVAKEFPTQEGVPFGYVATLVRDSYVAGLEIRWAGDMLREAVKESGLPPRVLDEPWANLTANAVKIPEGDVPGYMKDLAEVADEVRRNNETLLSLVFGLAEQRTARAYGMYEIFGDAASRNKNVVEDSARGMNKQLDNTTLDVPRSYGLTGVFTSDAIDRARYTNEFIDRQLADLGTIINAWSGLEHQKFVLATLASVSPVKPPEPTPQDGTPALGLVAVVAALAVVAVALRRKT